MIREGSHVCIGKDRISTVHIIHIKQHVCSKCSTPTYLLGMNGQVETVTHIRKKKAPACIRGQQ